MQRFLNQLIPFLLIAIAIIAFAFGIMLLAYLFLFGAMIGIALFLFSWIKQKLFPAKVTAKPQPKSGRIIDLDEWKEL